MYYPEITIARAIACIGVVILHAGFPFFVLNETLAITVMELFGFSTPLYVAISGFLIARSRINSDVSFLSFIGRKIKYLVPPFLFWGLIYLVEANFLGNKVDYQNAVTFLLLGQSKGHLYFVPLIMQLYVIYYIIKRYNLLYPLKCLYMGLGLSLGWLAMFNQLNIITGDARVFFPSVMFAFSIGYYLGETNQAYNRLVKLTLLIIAALCFTGLLTISFYKNTITPTWNVVSLFYGGSMIYLIFYLCKKAKRVPYIVDKISNYSFSIYLIHWLCLDIVTLIFAFNEVNMASGYEYIVLVFIALFMAYYIGVIGNKLPYGYLFFGRCIKNNKYGGVIIDR